MEILILLICAVFAVLVTIISFWRDDFFAFFFSAFLWLVIGINIAASGIEISTGQESVLSSVSNNTYSNISELISSTVMTSETVTDTYSVYKSPIVSFVAALLIGFAIYCLWAGYEGIMDYRNNKIEE